MSAPVITGAHLAKLKANSRQHCTETNSLVIALLFNKWQSNFQWFWWFVHTKSWWAFLSVRNQDKSCLGHFSMLWGTCTETWWTLHLFYEFHFIISCSVQLQRNRLLQVRFGSCKMFLFALCVLRLHSK